MSKKLKIGVVLVGLCALSLLLLSCGSSSSRPSGLLYVLTQGTSGSGNNVSSFSIDLNSGNLSLINSNATVCCGLPVSIVLDPTGATAARRLTRSVAGESGGAAFLPDGTLLFASSRHVLGVGFEHGLARIRPGKGLGKIG